MFLLLAKQAILKRNDGYRHLFCFLFVFVFLPFFFCFLFFFYLGFVSRTFTMYRTAGDSLLPLPPASQTFRHQPGDYCRELTSIHSLQPDSNREPLVSERKSLTSKLRAQPLRYAQAFVKSKFDPFMNQSSRWCVCASLFLQSRNNKE